MKCCKISEHEFGELFRDVQTLPLFEDSKTFVDATPRFPPAEIRQRYAEEKHLDNFNLANFVAAYFDLPLDQNADESNDARPPIRQYVNSLWDQLIRGSEDYVSASSLIPLPYSFVVPGGRFREIYYWDSFFTMLGLASAKKVALIEDMIKNFAYLIDEIGFIPNGNRSYFCSRSQPPVFAMMVELLAAQKKDPTVVSDYYPQLRREYQFWMSDSTQLNASSRAHRRIVYCKDTLLNRYWDDVAEPRPESHKEDLALVQNSQQPAAELFRNIRAACESGWDFSSRWLQRPDDLSSISTTAIVPLDLNCLLYKLESVLATGARQLDNDGDYQFYRQRAQRRREIIQSTFYNDALGYFTDLNLQDFSQRPNLTLATVWPLFFSLATQNQADTLANNIAKNLLKPGGWVTTSIYSNQQWDAPNGWAPLQWMVYHGLKQYGFHELALEGAHRWIDNINHVYQDSGRLLEKYDVETVGKIASGGEYRAQEGFGWTNGVLLALLDELDLS